MARWNKVYIIAKIKDENVIFQTLINVAKKDMAKVGTEGVARNLEIAGTDEIWWSDSKEGARYRKLSEM